MQKFLIAAGSVLAGSSRVNERGDKWTSKNWVAGL